LTGRSATAVVIRSQVGRTAVVTGANTGIGLEVAASLAAAGARTVRACRNDERAAAGREEIFRRHRQLGETIVCSQSATWGCR
jgi:NAD(P)-dependent dehydrogenase (short-subunit alcohol dehydrogenase family)